MALLQSLFLSFISRCNSTQVLGELAPVPKARAMCKENFRRFVKRNCLLDVHSGCPIEYGEDIEANDNNDAFHTISTDCSTINDKPKRFYRCPIECRKGFYPISASSGFGDDSMKTTMDCEDERYVLSKGKSPKLTCLTGFVDVYLFSKHSERERGCGGILINLFTDTEKIREVVLDMSMQYR